MVSNRNTVSSVKNQCPLCKHQVSGNLRDHMKKAHGENDFKKAVLKAKEGGMPDPEIGVLFNITFRELERIITEAYGINISVLKKPKTIKHWGPKDFGEETATVWSFKQRGNWVTHDGRYRGNWSPYIPRNVILKYSKPGDIVLDYFVGGGTAAIEAKLLGRRCIAKDINPAAIGLTKENLKFSPPNLKNYPIYEPDVSVADARNLGSLPDESIDLICAHPPYAGIIKYSSKIQGDLSNLGVDEFMREMEKVARESFRLIKPGGKCAILIGDTRKRKHVVPIGFRTIRVFLDAGFILKELVIKRQHNCKSTGFWRDRSIKYNFLLLAHEYLPIFEKQAQQNIKVFHYSESDSLQYKVNVRKIGAPDRENLETSAVWIFPYKEMDQEIKRNLIARFATPYSQYMDVNFDATHERFNIDTNDTLSLVYVSPPKSLVCEEDIASYKKAIKKIAEEASGTLADDGFLVIDARDVRIGGVVHPMALEVWEDMSSHNCFAIKEIVVVTPDTTKGSVKTSRNDAYLEIVHRYLLTFVLTNSGR